MGVVDEELRLILDHLEQGLVTVDRSGSIRGQRSRILDRWFGPAAEGERLWDWLERADGERRRWFAAAWEAVSDDVLPLEVALGQLPRSHRRGPATFELDYKVLGQGAAGDGVQRREGPALLVVITDITGRLERERSLRERRELAEIVDRLCRHRSSVLQFFEEARNLAGDAIGDDPVVAARALHTLKGSAGLMGLEGLVQLCHELEGTLEPGASLSAAARERLRSGWGEMERRFAPLVGHTDDERLDVRQSDFQAALAAVDRGAPLSEIRARLVYCQHEPVKERLEELGEHAATLAARLGKGPLEVRVEAGTLRLPARALGEFWSACVHVIRNAVDHGLETPEERRLAGKGDASRLTLSARLQGEGGAEVFEVEIADAGKGVDWDRLRRRAGATDAGSADGEDLVELLFADGLSTKDVESEISGRGFGMSAARQACVRAGGTVSVVSERGSGTAVRFRFPAAAVGVLEEPRAAAQAEAGGRSAPAPVASAGPTLATFT